MASEIKDFLPEHADKIISFGMNSKLMEIDASFEDNRICNYSTKGNAYTMFSNGEPVFAIGIVILWDCYKTGMYWSAARGKGSGHEDSAPSLWASSATAPPRPDCARVARGRARRGPPL